MLGAKQRAAGTAPENDEVNRSYGKCAPKSTKILKEHIGELLLCLQNPSLSKNDQQQRWWLFEALLARYLAVKSLEGVK